jgi:hypothetical protein
MNWRAILGRPWAWAATLARVARVAEPRLRADAAALVGMTERGRALLTSMGGAGGGAGGASAAAGEGGGIGGAASGGGGGGQPDRHDEYGGGVGGDGGGGDGGGGNDEDGDGGGGGDVGDATGCPLEAEASALQGHLRDLLVGTTIASCSPRHPPHSGPYMACRESEGWVRRSRRVKARFGSMGRQRGMGWTRSPAGVECHRA